MPREKSYSTSLLTAQPNDQSETSGKCGYDNDRRFGDHFECDVENWPLVVGVLVRSNGPRGMWGGFGFAQQHPSKIRFGMFKPVLDIGNHSRLRVEAVIPRSTVTDRGFAANPSGKVDAASA